MRWASSALSETLSYADRIISPCPWFRKPQCPLDVERLRFERDTVCLVERFRGAEQPSRLWDLVQPGKGSGNPGY